MRIAIFTTGGTIDKVYFDAKGGYEVGASMVEQFLNHGRVSDPIPVTELLRKDSLEVTDADRAIIRDAIEGADTNQIIVTHGTDTMVRTARSLGDIRNKTVVLTGALQPGRFADSDGPFNLGMAIAAVQTLPPGIYIVANGRVFHAAHVRKNAALNRFEAIEEDLPGDTSSQTPPPPPATPAPKPEDITPIKLPNPPEETQPEIPKVGSRDAPGG